MRKIEFTPMGAPEPDDEMFKRKALAEIAEATRRAWETMGINSKVVHIPGRCSKCACPRDEYTPGCQNCGARHSARRTKGRKPAVRGAGKGGPKKLYKPLYNRETVKGGSEAGSD